MLEYFFFYLRCNVIYFVLYFLQKLLQISLTLFQLYLFSSSTGCKVNNQTFLHKVPNDFFFCADYVFYLMFENLESVERDFWVSMVISGYHSGDYLMLHVRTICINSEYTQYLLRTEYGIELQLMD
jgi:hypothetical protein